MVAAVAAPMDGAAAVAAVVVDTAQLQVDKARVKVEYPRLSAYVDTACCTRCCCTRAALGMPGWLHDTIGALQEHAHTVQAKSKTDAAELSSWEGAAGGGGGGAAAAGAPPAAKKAKKAAPGRGGTSDPARKRHLALRAAMVARMATVRDAVMHLRARLGCCVQSVLALGVSTKQYYKAARSLELRLLRPTGNREQRALMPLEKVRAEMGSCGCAAVPPLAWLAATWAKFEECGGGKRVIQGENATIASLVWDDRMQRPTGTCGRCASLFFGIPPSRAGRVVSVVAECERYFVPRVHGLVHYFKLHDPANRMPLSVRKMIAQHLDMFTIPSPEKGIVKCASPLMSNLSGLVRGVLKINPELLDDVSPAAIAQQMRRHVSETGARLKPFSLAHNACHICKDGDARVAVALAAAAVAKAAGNETESAAHKEAADAARASVRDHRLDAEGQRRLMHLLSGLQVQLVAAAQEAGTDFKKRHKPCSLDLIMFIVIDDKANFFNPSVLVECGTDLWHHAVELTGVYNENEEKQDNFLYEGRLPGKKTANHTISSLLMYIIDHCIGQKVLIIACDCGSLNRNKFVVLFFIQFLVDAGIFEAAMVLFYWNLHGASPRLPPAPRSLWLVAPLTPTMLLLLLPRRQIRRRPHLRRHLRAAQRGELLYLRLHR
jgi:hypothetical protein